MDLIELYYSEVVGSYNFDNDDNKIESQKVIDYLKENQISDNDIVKFIVTSEAKDKLTFDMLPDWLWNSSLLKKDTFYYHNVLHIVSKPPLWNPTTNIVSASKFYLEMKIIFSMTDLLLYYYRKLDVEKAFIDEKRDIGSFNYLLNKYNKIDIIEPIDFVLSLIDEASSKECRISNILELASFEQEVYMQLKTKIDAATLSGANSIVWR